MVCHVVLVAPRPGLTPAEHEAFVAAFEHAARDIPSVRRVRIGRRVRHGPVYEARMQVDYPIAAVFEFDDLAGLKEYLSHPAHADLGARFYDSLSAALAYDYEMDDASSVRRWFPPGEP